MRYPEFEEDKWLARLFIAFLTLSVCYAMSKGWLW